MIDNTTPLSPRGTQPSASKLLRQPQIEAALITGRQRRPLHLRQRDRRLRIGPTKASQAQRAGTIELRIANHRNQAQRVPLRLGKLQVQPAGIVELRVSTHRKQEQQVTLKLSELQVQRAGIVELRSGTP